MAFDLSVRQLLNKQGVDNSRIGWNNQTGTVLIDGKDFMKPQKNLAGTSYTDLPGFNQAYQNFNNNNLYQGGIFQPAQSGTPQERLIQYASNPQQGYGELDRASKVYGAKGALGDTQGATAAHDWANKVRSAMGIQNQYDPKTGAFQGNPYDRQVNDLLSQIMNYQPAQIDPYSTPQYAASQEQAQRGAQQGIRSAQESLGESGFARSTNLADRAQRIQNESNEYLQTQVIPQIIAQEQAKQQQQYQNMQGLLGALMGQQENFETKQLKEATLAETVRANQVEEARKLEESQADIENKQILAELKKSEAITDAQYKQAMAGTSQQRAQIAAQVAASADARGWENIKISQEKLNLQKGKPDDTRTKAIQELTKMYPGGKDADGNPRNNFSKMSKAKQEQLISERTALYQGGSATPVTTKAPITKAPVKQSAIYTEAISNLKATKGLNKAKALEYANAIKGPLGKDYQNVVNYINKTYK